MSIYRRQIAVCGWISFSIWALLIGEPLVAAAGKPASRPNFVFILGEGQGWSSTSVQMDDTVPASKSSLTRTPNLERLAAEGLRWASFYAPSPRCTPSRAGLLTGKSPALLHMTFVGDGRDSRGGHESSFSETGSRLLPPQCLLELPAQELTIGQVLKRAGYATAHFGKWHLGRANPTLHGFDENDGPTSNRGPANTENPNPREAFGMTERGIDFMARQVRAGRPFYLQVSHYPGRGSEAARPETWAAVKSRAVRPDMRQVEDAAMTEDMDATIGMLLKKIDQLGIAGRTYVIYTADHGSIGRASNAPLAGSKGTLFEGGLRVPFVIRGPGIRGGGCSHVRATGVDLFPTLAELAGVSQTLPAGLEGGSLVPVLYGRGGAVKRAREELTFHFPHYDHDNDGPASAIIVGNYKLILSYETGTAHLYDLTKDLSERFDLVSAGGSKAAELQRRLVAYLQAVSAQLPTPNPQYDPRKASSPENRPPAGKGPDKKRRR